MRSLRTLTVIFLATVTAYAAYSWAPPAAGRYLVDPDQLEPAEIIVVLAGDVGGSRIDRALELHQGGLAPRIMVDGSYNMFGVTECDTALAYALRQGAAAGSVEKHCNQAGSTLEESILVDRLLTERGIRTAIVVTSDFHTRRAKRIFRRNTSGSVRYLFAASPTPNFDPDAWWRDREGREIAGIEWLKTLHSWWEGL